MNLNFNSAFGQNLLAQIIRKIIKRKLGCNVDVQISNLSLFETRDDKSVCLTADFALSVSKNDVDKLVDKI